MDENSNDIKLTLNARELAKAIGFEYSTVRQYASKHPELLPPRCKLPTRKLLWDVDVVREWVKKHNEPAMNDE